MEQTCHPPLNVFLSQSMQRKVNRSDSDYHYGKEKYKRNVYKMMLECKQREVMPGDINDYSRYKDGIVYNEPCVLARCRVNALSSRQNCPDSMHQSFHVKLISGCIKQFRPSAIIKSNFLPGTYLFQQAILVCL